MVEPAATHFAKCSSCSSLKLYLALFLSIHCTISFVIRFLLTGRA